MEIYPLKDFLCGYEVCYTGGCYDVPDDRAEQYIKEGVALEWSKRPKELDPFPEDDDLFDNTFPEDDEDDIVPPLETAVIEPPIVEQQVIATPKKRTSRSKKKAASE